MRPLLVTLAVFAATCAGLAPTPAPAAEMQVSQSSEDANVAKINIPGSPHFNPDLPVVLAPKLIKMVEAAYTEQARRDKFNAVVGVRMIVDESGEPRDVKVAVPVGHGLDEAAIKAAKQWRFEPATRDGKPVAVALQAEVQFRIY